VPWRLLKVGSLRLVHSQPVLLLLLVKSLLLLLVTI
jgi:hypothetical protein